MKITRIETYRTAKIAVVKVYTDDGVIGIGQTGAGNAEASVILLHTVIAPHFIGQNPWHLKTLIYTCLRKEYKHLGAAFYKALCGVDTALWDLLGKSCGQPVYHLLGGKMRDTVPMYASRQTRETQPEAEIEQIQAGIAEYGFRAVKIKIGGRMGNDVDALPNRSQRLIPLLRKAVGDDIALCVDANGGYTRQGAIKIGRMLEAYNYYHLEEPCPYYETANIQAVAQALDIPVAAGEQDNSLPHFQQMIQQQTVDIIQADVGHIGGVTRLIKVAELAEIAGIPFTPHCANHSMQQMFTLHVATAMPACHMFQEYTYGKEKTSWTREIFTPNLYPVQGSLAAPDAPGWGVEINPDYWQKAQMRTSIL